MQKLQQDVRYAIRCLRRSPGFFFAVVGTIALGVGVNTAFFTVFNAYALRPFAVHNPETLYNVAWLTRSGHQVFSENESERALEDLTSVSEAHSARYSVVRIDNQPLVVGEVSSNYFSMLGVSTALGRPFLESDAPDTNTPVVVLSDAAWRNRFAADPGILGKTLRVRGGFYAVVGVARPGFDGLGNLPADLWVTRRAADATGLDAADGVGVIVRLQPRVTPEQAEAEMLGRARQLTAERPQAQRIVTVQLTSAATALSHDAWFIAAVTPIMAAFVLILLIACANVANMMLARAVSRQREIGIRISIGATRSRLIRQLMTEVMLLVAPATLAGFVISLLIVRATERVILATLPAMLGGWFRPLNLAPDNRVFLFGCGISIVAVLACGLIPALRLARPSLVSAIRGESIQGVSASRLCHILVIAQVTVCLVLLICAGVFLRTSRQFAQHDSGMALRGVMSLQFKPATPEVLTQRLEQELTNASWVQSTAVATQAPVAESLASLSIATTDDSSQIRSRYNSVSSDYLPLLGIPITRGRNFTAQETEYGADVVILSETAARQLWPNGDGLGRSVRIMHPENLSTQNRSLSGFRIARVIGIAKDVSGGTLFEKPDPSYLYFPTHARDGKSHLLLVRLTDDSNATHRALDELLEKVAPETVQSTVSLQGLVDTQRWPFRIGFMITALLGTLALLLTVSGIYGVLAYMVASRTREMGVRMALGATVSRVVRSVLLQSMRLTLVGLGFGLLLALGVSRLFAAGIETVNTFDLGAYLGGVTVVLLAAIAAAYFPSRRAARVDPMVALRAE